MDTADAVVVGAGHHGLIAAIRLANAGWDVTVIEAQPEAGGAVRSAELTPGYVTDLFSAFYPLAVASPGFADLDLASHGLRWSRAPFAFGHPNGPADRNAAVVHPDAERTAALLAAGVPHWHRLFPIVGPLALPGCALLGRARWRQAGRVVRGHDRPLRGAVQVPSL